MILDIARRRFLAEGYHAVTLRSIAAEAGVDLALISYFFGSEKGLFGAVLALAANPAEVLAQALTGDPATGHSPAAPGARCAHGLGGPVGRSHPAGHAPQRRRGARVRGPPPVRRPPWPPPPRLRP
ncbi:TetR family transcriptional regulator [Kitasatospora sp. NBC_01287]|uniref:TetR family transcriptional regulator n=1 Tax=Kitasatospora sp. NBC_01287 TaxID=2903573 RepID=UPI0022584C74|nr:TetR family transcriptional regulator [Kitasatospora sp. NBC_01287]MCX4744276.1 TetR family transcriptional regulator [Kitasatospora sp. NBC_01287]